MDKQPENDDQGDEPTGSGLETADAGADAGSGGTLLPTDNDTGGLKDDDGVSEDTLGLGVSFDEGTGAVEYDIDHFGGRGSILGGSITPIGRRGLRAKQAHEALR